MRAATPSTTMSFPDDQPFGAERAGGDRDVLVGLEVAHLLLLLAGAEREGAVVPDAAEGYGVGSAVCTDGDQPVRWASVRRRSTSSQSGGVAAASP